MIQMTHAYGVWSECDLSNELRVLLQRTMFVSAFNKNNDNGDDVDYTIREWNKTKKKNKQEYKKKKKTRIKNIQTKENRNYSQNAIRKW